jgi:hypothetical protein
MFEFGAVMQHSFSSTPARNNIKLNDFDQFFVLIRILIQVYLSRVIELHPT